VILRKRPPRLMQSMLSGSVYVVTRYKDLGGGHFYAQQKYDVTPDFDAILALRRKRAKKARK
jgi:hypothetical protein